MIPKVSIILGCYNQRPWVKQAMDSALSQTHSNIEIVATDNGSTDGTAELLKSYEADKRVKFIFRETNSFATKLLNEAIARTSGEFVTLLNGDDYFLPEKLERQVEAFSRASSDCGVVYGPTFRLNAVTGEQWVAPCLKESGYILKEMLLQFQKGGAIDVIPPLVRRECFLRYPFFEDYFGGGEDVFFRIAMTYKFLYIDEPLCVMRDHLSNAGKAIKKNRDWAVPVYDRLGEFPEFPKELQPTLNRFIARFLRNYGWQGIRVIQDPGWARECYLMALGYDRAQLFHPRTVAGLVLSLLPEFLLKGINRVADRMVAQKGNAVFKQDYS